jgi:DNA-binding transcriptional LysR family regulator
MRAAATSAVIEETDASSSAQPRTIKLALTEGIAAYWLMPRLATFQRDYPDVLIRLRTDQRAADQGVGGTDVSVQLKPPKDDVFHVEEIGTLHLMPFASPAYLAERGTPKHFDEWRAHRLVWQDWEPEAQEIMPLFIADDAPSRIISMVTASTPAQLAAIEAGIGLGLLADLHREDHGAGPPGRLRHEVPPHPLSQRAPGGSQLDAGRACLHVARRVCGQKSFR